jgi:ABC-2 type transport system permease protein
MILFGYVVTTDVRDIRMALIDQSRTPESRRLVDAFDGNPTFRSHPCASGPEGAGPDAAAAPGRHRGADPA